MLEVTEIILAVSATTLRLGVVRKWDHAGRNWECLGICWRELGYTGRDWE